MRAGPLRVAVLANGDAAQASAAVQAVDRWVARTPGEARSCPSAPEAPPPAQPGTYAVDLPDKGLSEALLAFPLRGGRGPSERRRPAGGVGRGGARRPRRACSRGPSVRAAQGRRGAGGARAVVERGGRRASARCGSGRPAPFRRRVARRRRRPDPRARRSAAPGGAPRRGPGPRDRCARQGRLALVARSPRARHPVVAGRHAARRSAVPRRPARIRRGGAPRRRPRDRRATAAPQRRPLVETRPTRRGSTIGLRLR